MKVLVFDSNKFNKDELDEMSDDELMNTWADHVCDGNAELFDYEQDYADAVNSGSVDSGHYTYFIESQPL
jgi:hypothetical protein